MKDGYKSINDILKEVAQDEGMSFREVRDLWGHQKKYIKKQMETDGVYAIFLPYIGTLSLNVKQFHKELRGKCKERYADFIQKVKNLENDHRYTEFNNAHKRITGVNRIARYLIRHYHTGIEKIKKILPHKYCWPIIEQYSNGVFEKRDEILRKPKREEIAKKVYEEYKRTGKKRSANKIQK